MGKISAFYTMPHPPIIIPEVGGGRKRRFKIPMMHAQL